MSLLETLRKDMFEARKASNANKANILGIAIASIGDFKIEAQRELTDEDIISILRKEEKKLQDAFGQYTLNGREDLAKIEKEQLEVISGYLPKLMSEEEIEKFVRKEMAEMDGLAALQIGKVMGGVMAQLKGKADGGVVSMVVKRIFENK
ncbi:GatB/YqeY domain-containing protein [Candidatus Dojkabacteria bacterium]|jgi:hypothetical protein|nr:GatB/YqeY domain-containing protein [Candidatus Dojkabacteria bacterium]